MALRDGLGVRLRRFGLQALWYRGDRVECPCCGRRFRCFVPHRGRPNALCPHCGSAERQRVLWLFIERETDLLSRQQSVLHFAPEQAIAPRLTGLPNLDYVSGDLAPGRAMEVMDVTSIPRPDATFDVVLCSHVLEHVPDDRLAMSELFRVLRPGGTAYMQHPIERGRAVTYEDATITEPADRVRAFWQDNHVRIYGNDFTDRLAGAGFDVTARSYEEELGEPECERYGLAEGQRLRWVSEIYVCRKPSEQSV